MHKKFPLALLPAVLAVLMAACGNKDDSGPEMSAGNDSAAVVDPILARVGETEIRQSQLDALARRLDAPAMAVVNAGMEEKMLQSLVRARTLAVAAERNMSAEERIELEARVQAFRDELLAQHYMQNQMVRQPVTAEQVKQYYESHLDDYSVPGRVQFEYLSANTEAGTSESERKQVIQALAAAKKQNNWRSYADKLLQRGLLVEFKSAQLQPHLVAEVIRSEVQALAEGEVSDLVYGDKMYLVRVLSREVGTTRPLHHVSSEIRKKLAPMQLKQALSDSAQQLSQEINVEIIK